MREDIVLMSISREELKELIAEVVKEQFTAFFDKKEPDTRLRTRNEVAEMLGISLPTLHAYTKDGLIKSVKLGSKRRYRLSDIEEALRSVPGLKYSLQNKK